tara:strand:+ start:505 stop:942 length:438 start_codon:yes stop_codon:yes gene_type:complete
MISLLFAIILSITPTQRYTVDYVDIIEVNYVYRNWQDPNTPTLEQSIYKKWKRTYYWSEVKNEKVWGYNFEVVDWRMLDKTGLPKKNWKTGKWEQIFYDDKSKCMRKIIAIGTVTSHTKYDPEVEARDFLSSNNRIKLRRPREQK